MYRFRGRSLRTIALNKTLHSQIPPVATRCEGHEKRPNRPQQFCGLRLSGWALFYRTFSGKLASGDTIRINEKQYCF